MWHNHANTICHSFSSLLLYYKDDGVRHFQWCSVTEQRQWAPTEIKEAPSEHQGTLFPLWGCLSTGTGFPGRLWSLHPWRYSEVVRKDSWATSSRWPWWSREIGPEVPTKLNHSVILSPHYFNAYLSPIWWILPILIFLLWLISILT